MPVVLNDVSPLDVDGWHGLPAIAGSMKRGGRLDSTISSVMSAGSRGAGGLSFGVGFCFLDIRCERCSL